MRRSNGLDRFDEFICFIPAFMVVEVEVLNDFSRFFGVLIAEFAAGDADIIAEFCGPSRWKELSKESGSKILSCGDGFCWKAFKPIASLIAKGKLK
ncbi:hypothetical protein Tco_0264393 [Tanacetum coccineum]